MHTVSVPLPYAMLQVEASPSLCGSGHDASSKYHVPTQYPVHQVETSLPASASVLSVSVAMVTSGKCQVPYTPVEMIKLRLLPVCSLCQWLWCQAAVPTWRADHSHNLGSCHLTPTATPHHSSGARIREKENQSSQKLTPSSDFSIGPKIFVTVSQ